MHVGWAMMVCEGRGLGVGVVVGVGWGVTLITYAPCAYIGRQRTNR